MTKLDRLCETVVSRIERGVLRAGDRLPSEARMATDFGVSVGTVQRALSRLAARVRSGFKSSVAVSFYEINFRNP